MRLLWLLPLFVWLPSSVVAQRSSAAATACYKVEGHADARHCLEEKAKRSAADLDAEETALRTALTRSGDESARQLAAFDDAVKRFRQYRASQCSFVAALAAGGNAATDRRLLCEIDLNEARIFQLSTDHPGGV
jgi:uncharacterized protein YecT (DUF1311 family)